MTKVTPPSRKRANPTKAVVSAPSTPPEAVAAPARKARAAKPAAASEAAAAPKAKLVRDSFTIPKPEYEALATLKRRAIGLGTEVKKGELLRAGIAALSAMSDRAFLAALKAVPSLKTGRPKAAAD